MTEYLLVSVMLAVGGILGQNLSWTDVGKIIQYVGVPGAFCLGLIYALWKGWLCLGREATKVEEEKRHVEAKYDAFVTRAQDRLDAALAACKQDYELRLALTREDRNFWRKVAIDGNHELQKATDTVAKAVDKIGRNSTPSMPAGGD